MASGSSTPFYLNFVFCIVFLSFDFSFVFVLQVVSHWWRQYSLLFWIDTIAMDLFSYLPGFKTGFSTCLQSKIASAVLGVELLLEPTKYFLAF